MAATVKKLDSPEMNIGERLFLFEIIKGMLTTNRHFWRNWFRRKDTVTLEYPEVKRPYPARWRGLHRLMKREDGSVRCVACMMCSTNCPANCITIVAGEHPDPKIEKYPVSFDIDLLKCIYCGYCEEACPCDAIRLDSGTHTAPDYTRRSLIAHKDEMLARGGPSIAKQGGRSL